ncbi:nucleoside-binding protein [Halobellus clavatus]|uniref:Nucleoside-binding protein n=2 Tax=Halobellus clavatus TaxID=660517 RepID=A0A1H3HKH2_9EURY|nr:BMP family ABC transporter substrate-binding protein [Halobellus clavatus]SDY15942.1 nucleoside-binding protein [Halobellus clavatus]
MSKQILTRRDALKAAGGTAGILGLAGCSGGSSEGSSDSTETSGSTETAGSTATTSSSGEEVNAAFIYQAEVGDVGWDRAHEDARQIVTEEYDWLNTEFSEAVAPGDVQRVIEQYISSGMDVIFGTTFGYMDPMANMAPDYPDTIFEHCSGFRTEENMGRYYGRLYQARYLCGVAAGLLTESNQLGYVAAFPIPELIRQINAFVEGARSVNPDVTAEIRWTNAWVDPPAVTQAVNALTSNGADVINNHQTTTAATQTAAENEAWAFTYTTSMAEAGGDYYGNSAVFNWEEFYGPTLEAIHEGAWGSDAYWDGLDAGVVGLGDWGPQIPDDVISEVETVQEELVSGDRTVWQDTQFEGESDSFLFSEMQSYVEGINGEVPSS